MPSQADHPLSTLARVTHLYTRLTYFRWVLPGAVLALALPLLLHHFSPYLGPFDQLAFPLIAALFVVLFGLSWTRVAVEVLEGIALAGMNVFVVVRLLHLLAEPSVPSAAAAMGGTTPWVLIVMITNAGFLAPRRSVIVNVLIMGALTLGTLVWWPGNRPSPERQYLINTMLQLLLAGGSVLLAHVVTVRYSVAYSRRARQALREASADALTGLPNRRALGAHLERRAAEPGALLAVALVDVDHFKSVNDRHGHGAGDDVLRGVAEALREVAGSGHLVGRYGGEEFLCLLSVDSPAGALAVAETLRLGIKERTFRGVAVTISVGVALAHAPAEPDALLEAADQALYAAKGAGRNRVELRGVDCGPLRAQPAGAA